MLFVTGRRPLMDRRTKDVQGPVGFSRTHGPFSIGKRVPIHRHSWMLRLMAARKLSTHCKALRRVPGGDAAAFSDGGLQLALQELRPMRSSLSIGAETVGMQ
jgi:hypothetical protein